jgi:hypothetical protein
VGGFAHQGYAGCPYCGPKLGVEHSTELGKQLYGGTRHWLDQNHPYRSEAMKGHFNGEAEDRDRPRVVTVGKQIQRAEKFQAWKSARNRDGAPGDPPRE